MVEAHPSTEQLKAFAAGRLASGLRADLEAHLLRCENCWAIIDISQSTLPVVKLLKALPPERRTRLLGPKTPVPLDTPLPPPELVDHPRYKIIEFVGQGGMGQIWKARHLMMNRVVAIKVINPTLLQSSSAVARFRREVEAAAKLAHPNIVTAFDAEQVGNLHLLVMEYVEGVDLARLVRDRGPLPVTEACDYARQVALGLAHAHSQHMVHRDIKPQNILRTLDGQIKITDFGLTAFLAEIADQDAGVISTNSNGSLTKLGEGCGTPDYISPEQVRDSANVDGRADIYSLGCTLYHLLAGQPPFAGGTGFSKVAGHLERTPKSLAEVRGDLPDDLLRVIDQMLAKDPRHRFQAAQEVAEALAPGKPGRITINRRRWLMGAAVAMSGVAGAGWLFLRRVPKAKEILRMEGHTAAVHDVALSPDQGFALSCGEDKTMRLWSLDAGQEVRWFEGHDDIVTRVACLPDGKRAVTASYDKTLKLWNLTNGKCERTYVGSDSIIVYVSISPDGKRMLSCGGASVLLWDVETATVLHRLGSDVRGQLVLRILSDSKRAVTAGPDRLIHLWNLMTGQEIARSSEISHSVEALGVSEDEKQVLAGCVDRNAFIWDLGSSQEPRRLTFPLRVYRVVSLPGGGFWAACNDDQGGIGVFDANTEHEVCRIQRHDGPVWGLAFSRDRRFALTGSKDRTVRLWELPT